MQGQGAPEHWPTWVRVAFNAFTNDTTKAEFKAIDATGQSVLRMPSYASFAQTWSTSILVPGKCGWTAAMPCPSKPLRP